MLSIALRATFLICTTMALWLPATGAAAKETIAEDMRRETVGGVTFTAPAGWQLDVRGPATLLVPPEGGSTLALVDVEAADADAAVAAAWSASGLEPKWPVKLASDQPAQDGWEEVRHYNYETSANERRFVLAIASRKDAAWNVLLVDFSESLLDKRMSQVMLVADKLLPPGYVRESFAGRQAHKLDPARIEALASFVRESQTLLGIPGVSIGVVQDGETVFAGGFGVRELGKPEQVDAHTLYMIASNTKALTTAMLARLVDRGLIAWDTPVASVMPGFALGDAETTRRVRVEHLVCACTGLPRQDFEWLYEFADATPESTLQSLAGMQPTSDFGALYQYSNPLASAGGYVGAHVLYPGVPLGDAYDRAMDEEVFGPLGMAATTFDFRRALAGEHAAPHGWDVEAQPSLANMSVNYAVVPIRPAGGAWSNVADMLRYVQMELDAGLLPDGGRYLSEAAIHERLKQKVAVGNDVAYGMGLETDTSRGIPVVHHGGSMIGYRSDMLWLPEHGVGAVILTNADEGGMLLGPFRRRLLELLFDGEDSAAGEIAAQARTAREWAETQRARLALPADPGIVASLASRYRNAALGDLVVRRNGTGLLFDLGEWQAEVASRVNDDGTHSLVIVSPGLASWFEFVVGESDGRKQLVLRSAQQEYVFEAQ